MVPRPKPPEEPTLRPSGGARALEETEALPTTLDKQLLRGVSLSTCLSGAGRHWSNNGSGRTAQAETDYGLSRQVQQLDHFLSHDWKTSRSQKYLTMLLIFNLQPALIISSMVSVVVAVVACFTVGKHQLWTALFGYAAFAFTLFYWQALRELMMRPTLVFLDKLCIAQHDPDLKEKGILGLASFLLNSDSLTIFWSPRYFTRLWCTYEIATYFKDDQQKRLDLMPVALSMQIVLAGAVAHTLTWSFKMLVSLVWDVVSHADAIIIVASVLVPTFSMLSVLQVYIGIGLLKDLAALPEQLSSFKVKDSECFCCSVDHVLPETGEEIPCDRKVVFQTLKTWYGKDEGAESHLDAFDDIVRKRLKDLVMTQMGKNAVPLKYMIPIILSSTVPFLPFYLPEWIEGQPDFSPLDQFTHQIRELVEFFKISVMSMLVTLLGTYAAQLGYACRGCISRLTASLLLGPLTVILVLILDLPLEVAFLLTRKYSLMPLIPFSAMLLCSCCLLRPPRCCSGPPSWSQRDKTKAET